MKTLKEQIKVMQGADDGGDVEVNSGKVWHETPFPSWNWADKDYRIKPEPMEFWVEVYESGNHTVHENHQAIVSLGHIKTIKVREVME